MTARSRSRADALSDRPTLTDAQAARTRPAGPAYRSALRRSRRTSNGAWTATASGSCRAGRSPRCFPSRETDEQGTRVYLSVGHQQMMTDAMKPLGLSMWRLTTPAPAREAGGRLFVDATRAPDLAGDSRELRRRAGAASDPLVGDALQTVIDRRGLHPDADRTRRPPGRRLRAAPPPLETDRSIVLELIAQSEASLDAAQARHRDARSACSPNRLYSQRHPGAAAGSSSTGAAIRCSCRRWRPAWRLNELLETLLGEKNAADTLAQSVPGNVTSGNGAQTAGGCGCPFARTPRSLNILQHVRAMTVFRKNCSSNSRAGRQAREAIEAFLANYGMRLRRRNRHHENPVERETGRADPDDPEQHPEPRAECRQAEIRSRGSRKIAGQGTESCCAGLRHCRMGNAKAAETRRKIDVPPGSSAGSGNTRRSANGDALFHLQAGSAAGSRAALSRDGVIREDGGYLLSDVR